MKIPLMRFDFELIEEIHRAQIIKMYRYFERECSEATGSGHNHQFWKGGYFDHIDDVLEYAQIMYTTLLNGRTITQPFSLSDALLVLLLHDIEKPIKYSSQADKLMKLSDENMRAHLIQMFDLELTQAHWDALKYIHGEGLDHRKDVRVQNPLSAFCHCCDVISARIFFDKPYSEYKNENYDRT